MAKKPLRSQLNQIRAWVQEGRTDAWIAHQLEIPAAELAEFKRRHGLTAEGGDPGDVDLRDEIEAEIEAATREAEEAPDEEEEEDEAEDDREDAAGDEDSGDGEGRAEGERGGRRRRRRRRGGRGRGRGRGGGGDGQRNGSRTTVEGTFDHGDEEGFGLWLDPAVQDDPAYTEHWAGHRAVAVVIEPDRIVIRRRD